MTDIGCLTLICLFVLLCIGGTITATRHGASALLGLALGAVAWLAVSLGYMCGLTVYDWLDSFKHPNRQGVPRWALALIWLLFAITAVGAAAMYRHVTRS